MPCTDRGPDYINDPAIVERLDLVTRLLCALCNKIEERGGIARKVYFSVEKGALKKWWKDHKRRDASKEMGTPGSVERALAVTRARAKLTAEERKILGI